MLGYGALAALSGNTISAFGSSAESEALRFAVKQPGGDMPLLLSTLPFRVCISREDRKLPGALSMQPGSI